MILCISEKYFRETYVQSINPYQYGDLLSNVFDVQRQCAAWISLENQKFQLKINRFHYEIKKSS